MAIVHITKENFESEITKSELPVVIDFWAEWCGPCRMMAPVFEELSKEYDGKVKFAKVNTDQASGVATQFGIQSIPTLVVLKNGKESSRIIGFGPKPAIKSKIDEALKK
ncbi:thioredoxin [Candidatus Woesearchaeota archaeon]|nr:thioredoxin [Candidatus Woesearchaeota archaeon]